MSQDNRAPWTRELDESLAAFRTTLLDDVRRMIEWTGVVSHTGQSIAKLVPPREPAETTSADDPEKAGPCWYTSWHGEGWSRHWCTDTKCEDPAHRPGPAKDAAPAPDPRCVSCGESQRTHGMQCAPQRETSTGAPPLEEEAQRIAYAIWGGTMNPGTGRLKIVALVKREREAALRCLCSGLSSGNAHYCPEHHCGVAAAT